MTAIPLSQDGTSKETYRRYYCHLRSTLDLVALSQSICDRLKQWPPLKQAETILSYYATDREINLLSLFSHWPQKTWGLPRTLPGGELAWHRYEPEGELKRSRLGILEPFPHSPTIDLETVDAILVPAIACDRQGIRLGYGGGYYDRCLGQPRLQHALTVGVVPFACWSLSALPRDPWDIPLAAIATEREIGLRYTNRKED
ncbi:MAG: 5-formyltetrahydrofolate cyclo-ligase [Synechococcus sp.]